MSLEEKTYQRKLDYSLWHRKLPSYCKAWNIDFVEVRNGRIVAFMEVAETIYPLELVDLKFKLGHKWLLDTLTKLTTIPSYIMFHNPNLTQFKVFNLFKGDVKLYDEKEYRNFLLAL